MRFAGIVCTVFLSLLAVNCSNAGSNEPLNQGYMIQEPSGDLKVYLNNKGFKNDPRFSPTTIFTAYVYKRNEYQVECGDDQFCEDRLIFRNDTIDSLGFSTDPGFYGYDSDRNSYSPRLNSSDPFSGYPSSRPATPDGFEDPDVFQCYYVTFRNGYECGINPNPIRKLDTSLSQFFLDVYAADGSGYPSFYIQDYNHFQSLNHPVDDGDRFFVYLAVHFNAIHDAARSEDRFKSNSSIWARPIKPDLISPRIPLTVKLLPESPQDRAGGTYPLPDFSTWRSPGCQADTVATGEVYISEIMWMGSTSLNGVDDNGDEFIELYNTTSRDLQVGGWKITGAGPSEDGTVQPLEIPDCTTLPAGKTLTIGEDNTVAFPNLDIVTTKISLRNSGTSLSLTVQDANGTTISSLGADCQGSGSSAWDNKGINSGGVERRSMRVPTDLSTAAATTISCATFDTTPVADTSGVAPSHSYSSSDSRGTAATPGCVPWKACPIP